MRVPRILQADDSDPGLAVVRSGFWKFQGIGFYSEGEALVIDPGIYPEDIALLGALVQTRARQGSERQVKTVVLTHSHHDHIRGWQHFPGAEVCMPGVAAEKTELAQSRILAGKQAIDERLGIEDPSYTYPKPQFQFEDPIELTVGKQAVHLFPLFGHSNCCSVVWIPSLRTLCTQDYLVSPGLPYCRWRADAFEQSLDWLAQFCVEHGVQTIWPAHNNPIQSPKAIQAAIAEDAGYMAFLREACGSLPHGEVESGVAAKRVATLLQERRGGKPSRATSYQDLDNAKRMLAEVQGSTP